MLRIATAFGALLALSSRLLAGGGQTFVGQVFENTYTVTVTDEDLRKSPPWDKRTENPPLAARNAIKRATDFKRTLVKDFKDWKWRLESITLKQGDRRSARDKWSWVVHFEEWPPLRPGHGFGAGVPDLYVIVLMDGTVMKPTLGKE